jgi:hypothetical protein
MDYRLAVFPSLPPPRLPGKIMCAFGTAKQARRYLATSLPPRSLRSQLARCNHSRLCDHAERGDNLQSSGDITAGSTPRQYYIQSERRARI